jgi:hypothetical protein
LERCTGEGERIRSFAPLGPQILLPDIARYCPQPGNGRFGNFWQRLARVGIFHLQFAILGNPKQHKH